MHENMYTNGKDAIFIIKFDGILHVIMPWFFMHVSVA